MYEFKTFMEQFKKEQDREEHISEFMKINESGSNNVVKFGEDLEDYIEKNKSVLDKKEYDDISEAIELCYDIENAIGDIHSICEEAKANRTEYFTLDNQLAIEGIIRGKIPDLANTKMVDGYFNDALLSIPSYENTINEKIKKVIELLITDVDITEAKKAYSLTEIKSTIDDYIQMSQNSAKINKKSKDADFKKMVDLYESTNRKFVLAKMVYDCLFAPKDLNYLVDEKHDEHTKNFGALTEYLASESEKKIKNSIAMARKKLK